MEVVVLFEVQLPAREFLDFVEEEESRTALGESSEFADHVVEKPVSIKSRQIECGFVEGEIKQAPGLLRTGVLNQLLDALFEQRTLAHPTRPRDGNNLRQARDILAKSLIEIAPEARQATEGIRRPSLPPRVVNQQKRVFGQ